MTVLLRPALALKKSPHAKRPPISRRAFVVLFSSAFAHQTDEQEPTEPKG